jgi:hypothetical protein
MKDRDQKARLAPNVPLLKPRRKLLAVLDSLIVERKRRFKPLTAHSCRSRFFPFSRFPIADRNQKPPQRLRGGTCQYLNILPRAIYPFVPLSWPSTALIALSISATLLNAAAAPTPAGLPFSPEEGTGAP